MREKDCRVKEKGMAQVTVVVKFIARFFFSLVYSGNRNDINGPRRKQKRGGGKEE